MELLRLKQTFRRIADRISVLELELTKASPQRLTVDPAMGLGGLRLDLRHGDTSQRPCARR